MKPETRVKILHIAHCIKNGWALPNWHLEARSNGRRLVFSNSL